MSDSDSDPGYHCDGEDTKYQNMIRTVKALNPSDDLLDRWCCIPVSTKKEAGERMKVCAFWFPILLQPEEPSNAGAWAVYIGLISHRGTEEFTMTELKRIEILEAILRALEKGSLERDQTKHLFHISNMLNMNAIEVFDKAMHWLERTEEPDIGRRIAEFGHINTCFATLQFVFTEFAKYIKEMGTNLEKTMEALMARPQEYIIEKSEEMKKRGNEHFQKQQFEDAVKFYSKAIKYYPDNHILYGNRALCYIRCKKYGKALADGKRATLIKPRWPKGHYRFCEALFMLGFVRYAIEANKAAQELCKDDHEGMKDLEQQFKLFTQTPDPKGGQLKNKTKRSGSANGADTVESHQSVKANFKSSLAANKAPQNKASEVKLNKLQVKNDQTTQAESSTKDSKPSKSDLSSKYGKGESGTGVKKKIKNTNCQSENQKVSDSKVAVCKELRSIVQDAHTALTDLRSRNAEQTFSQALSIVETNTPKDLGLSTVDVQLLLYGRASALTEIGQPEELVEAQKLLEKIKSFEERTFQCLVYYAIGRVYVKENRFTVALEQFSDSLQMVKNQITPGKLTWPLTKEIVKETQSEYLKEILERSIEFCKFPPIPDAICRLVKCLVPLKPEIYFTDPDFKGFIRIGCCQSCTVEYHIACWKTLKTSSFSEKSEKDFLQEPCLTPDCVGKICNIRIYGPTGLLKCKFEASIVRPETPKKPKVNQKCTSLKKLKSKEERRLKRKQHKLSNEDKQTISEDLLQKKEDSATQTQQKAWLIYRDRVLLQISQHMELLKEESGLHVSALITSLKPWLELDSSRGNRLAQRMLNWQQEALETLGQAVELLLERKSRVWACVFIQVLSSCVDVNPKLNTWACKLNDAGLDAAKSFIERYTDHLEQLDLTLLLTFGPLQEMMKEKLGTRPEVFSSISFTVTEYLKQAPPHDTRLFIWTLEEHRDEYLSCHTILDEYFDMMDGHCSVLKKSDESQNNSPLKTKNRGRKKKQKEPKGVIVLSGMRAVTPRDEWDQDFFEDDSLSFLHHAEPFTVPSHLRDQVADFEEQYNSTRNRSHYKNVLDNNPDPTKESLYDYFAQILEEHGPLVAEDPLLVGELENFPQVAQLKIQEAGGFESFLLDSLRFIKMGRRIGLAKHAVSLQQAGHGDNLDDLDVIVDPDANSESPNLEETAFTSYLNNISSAETDVYPILPNPYMYNFESASGVTPYVDVRPGINLYPHWSNGDNQQQDPNFLFPNYGNLDLYTCGFDGGDWQMDPSLGGTASLSTEENKRHAAVQTCQETGRNVAVNTELHERFESCQGDINKMEKNNHQLEQQIKNMVNGCDKVSLKHKEEITYLGEEIQTITANIQVTNKELALFQQKLEEEVKQDQKEKKANQEALKSLKLEIEKLVEEHGSLARNIREKKDQYEAKLADFLELGNQSAAEKMSLEDEIKRCKAVLNAATRRSHTAQLLVVESSRDQGLYSLYTELADAKALLSKLDEVAHRYPNQDLEIIKNTWRANVQEVEKKISIAETQYKEQIDQVKNGGRVSELIAVNMNNQSEPANAPLTVAAKEFTSQSSAQMSFKAPSPIQFSVAETPVIPAQPHPKPPTRTLEPPHGTVFNKAMERLTAIFPDTTRSDLMKFIQELRSSSGGSFASMSLQDVVGGVTQLILDHQDKLNSARSNIVGSRHPSQCATPPLVTPAPVWQLVGPQRTTHSKALNMEDPCIICHEDMSPDDICVLECRHSFHKECIRSWLKEQSTCPTCRDHALLPEDFPVLTGRKRQIP